jgi:ribonuclease J
MHFLETILKDEKLHIKNKRKTIRENSSMIIQGKNEKYKIEFIHTTHSTIQCSFLALHTKQGIFFYALDFKLDNYPILGNPPNYKRLKEIGRKGVKVLIINAMNSGKEGRTQSERIARHLLEEAFSHVRNKKSAFFVTTFSSHIARLKSIVDFAQKTNRKIIFLGRSLSKYIECATKANLCPFRNKINLFKYRGQVNSILKKIEKDRGKYIVVCTGHQAEKGSILDRIVQGETPFKLRKGDNIIFASSVIPVAINIAARERLDKKLNKQGVRLQKGVHVSGHASQEDMLDLIEMLKPEHIIPAHGSHKQEVPLIEATKDFGYVFGETSHLTSDGKLLKF